MLGYGTDYFTSPPKEGRLWIFPPGKIRRLRSGANPRSWVPEASMLNIRPPKPLFTLCKWKCKTGQAKNCIHEITPLRNYDSFDALFIVAFAFVIMMMMMMIIICTDGQYLTRPTAVT
jgi:hypothetical protein